MKKIFFTFLAIIVCVIAVSAVLVLIFHFPGNNPFKENGHTLYADYENLNASPINKPLNIVELLSVPQSGYVDALRVADLYGDGQRELIYLEHGANEGNIKIVSSNGKELASCYGGQSTNQYYYLAIDDINHDGRPEIITTGGDESDYEQIRTKYGLAGGAWSQYNPVNIEFSGRDDLGPIEPSLLADLDRYVKGKYKESMSSDGKKLTITMAQADYIPFASNNYSLVINDNRCIQIAKYKISDDILGAGMIFTKDIGTDKDKEIVFNAVYSGKEDGVYFERDGVVAKNNDPALASEARARMDAEQYPLSEALAAKLKVGADSLVGDVNGDGKDEVVAFIYEPSHGSAVVPQAIFVLDPSTGDVLWKYSFDHQLYSEFKTLGDINNDGVMEIIAGGDIGSPIEVFGLKK